MNRAFLLPAFLAMAALAHAQQQEGGMMDRIDANWKKGMEAMGGQTPGKKGKKVAAQTPMTSSLQSKKFEGTTFASKTYDTGAFQGTKSADVKTFETRSFFGIKNPWFGRKVFDTNANQLAARENREAERVFRTEAMKVKEYGEANATDAQTAEAVLPTAAEPRVFRGPEQRDKKLGIDRFTQNLSKDLTIDDVRDLLNKGKGQ